MACLRQGQSVQCHRRDQSLRGPALYTPRTCTCPHSQQTQVRGAEQKTQSAGKPRESAGKERAERAGHLCLQWPGQVAPWTSIRRSIVARATIEDPELVPLVRQLEEQRPTPPQERDKLVKAINMIDEANSKDPKSVDYNGRKVPYRLLYSHWTTEWVEKLDPKASDELLILARGRNVESWRNAEIKRDAYSPNSAGSRQWEGDKRRAQAARLIDIMKAAGYDGESVKLVEGVMLDKNLPDPRDIRKHDLVLPLGQTNFRLLEQACMIQVLRDADAMVFVEKSFPEMSTQLPADEVLPIAQRELARISLKAGAQIMDMDWSPAQRKLLAKAMPAPRRFGTLLKELEGVASASTHPGDWRYRDFDYE